MCKITVFVEDGRVVGVDVPPNLAAEVEVRDYDAPNAIFAEAGRPPLHFDGEGKPYVPTLWPRVRGEVRGCSTTKI